MANDKSKAGKGLKDPVDDGNEAKAAADMAQEMATLDPESRSTEQGGMLLEPGEVGAIKERRTSAPHPFDGYRLGRKVIVGETQISSTFIVLLSPLAEPVPDPSNDDNDVYVGGDGTGTPRSGGKRKTVRFPTSHTRVVTNRHGNQNEQVVFDRTMVLADGSEYKCAIVRGHSQRAQIVFTFDPDRNRVMVDKRYMLADKHQAPNLLKLFEAIYSQRTHAEKAARDFDAAQESTAADKE